MPERHVLILEDNPDDQVFITRALSECSFGPRVEFARDGAEALERLRRKPLPPSAIPSLIIVDLMMPRMNGFEFLRALRQEQQFRYTPVVVFTSSDVHKDVLQSYTSGATSFVQKPTAYKEFQAALCTLVHYWLQMNHQPLPPRERSSTSPPETLYSHPSRRE